MTIREFFFVFRGQPEKRCIQPVNTDAAGEGCG